VARVTAAPGIIIDRFHRGAVVMVGAASFAVPEQIVCLLEKVSRWGAPYQPQGAVEEETARELVSCGILREAP
jgi:hypothetical protein